NRGYLNSSIQNRSRTTWICFFSTGTALPLWRSIHDGPPCITLNSTHYSHHLATLARFLVHCCPVHDFRRAVAGRFLERHHGGRRLSGAVRDHSGGLIWGGP